MKILWTIIGLLWLVGWIKELANIDALMLDQKKVYPSRAFKYAVAGLVLFMWPYFYFYRKS